MFTKSKDHNENYLASVVKIDNVRKHTNADRLQVTTIFGNNVITGLDCKEGDIYVYFPLESALSKDFLEFTNSFADPELNKDKTAKGFFDKNGRVRAIRLRQERSEGYIIPIAPLAQFMYEKEGIVLRPNHFVVGTDFDTIENTLICKKYIPVNQRMAGQGNSKKTKGNVKKYVSKLVENQFRFHYDTAHLKKNMHRVGPDDYVAITKKYHGTSFVVSNVLVKKQLPVYQKLLKFLGANVVDMEYGMLYSSRQVIKNRNFVTNESLGFYGSDVWKDVAEKLFPFMTTGISVYGEIVGYSATGKELQKGYNYGCKPNEHDVYIYRVTYTSASGEVFEFSHHQLQKWCDTYGLKMVKTYYYGKLKDLYPDVNTDEHWHAEVLNRLINDYLEKDCDQCVAGTPDEGVVLRKETPNEFDAFKLKSFRFLERETKELDKGEIDMETAESMASDEEIEVDNTLHNIE